MPPATTDTHDLDGLDDLDDVLNEFSEEAQPAPAPVSASKTAGAGSTGASGAKKATVDEGTPTSASAADSAARPEEDLLSDDFAAQFAQGLQDMLAGLGEAPPAADAKEGNGGKAKAAPAGEEKGSAGDLNEDELMKQFERMLFGGTGLDPNAGASTSQPAGSAESGSGPPGSSGSAKPGNFQDTIAATMNRLKTSDKNATSSTGSGAGQDDLRKMFEALGGAGGEGAPNFEELLKGLGDLGDLGDGEGYQKMLENMLADLMGKEVLYSPIKEMNDQYPSFLASDKFKALSTEDQERFTKQAGIVKQIVVVFEDPEWEDAPDVAEGTDPESRPPVSPAQQERQKKLQELMNAMQDCGAPPDEIVGDMPEGLDSLGKAEDCTIM